MGPDELLEARHETLCHVDLPHYGLQPVRFLLLGCAVVPIFFVPPANPCLLIRCRWLLKQILADNVLPIIVEMRRKIQLLPTHLKAHDKEHEDRDATRDCRNDDIVHALVRR